MGFFRPYAGKLELDASFGSVEPGIVAVGTARLAVVFFCPDVAAGHVERALKTLELACIDQAVGAKIVLHEADVALLLLQPAEFAAGQAAFPHASNDAFHLSILACIDLLAESQALLVSAPTGVISVALPAGLRRRREQAECQQSEGFFHQSALHDVLLFSGWMSRPSVAAADSCTVGGPCKRHVWWR